MKYLLWPALMLLTVTAASARNEKDRIIDLLNAQKDAWNRGDIDGYMEGYWQSDSLVFVSSSGITKGWHQTLERYKRSYSGKEQMGTLDFVFEQVDIIKEDEAFVLGKWHIRRNSGDLGGYFTLRLKKMAGGWKVVLDHSS